MFEMAMFRLSGKNINVNSTKEGEARTLALGIGFCQNNEL